MIKLKLLGILIVLTITSCAPPQIKKQRAIFHDLNYRRIIGKYRVQVSEGYKSKDSNYPLHLLNYAAILQYSGDLDSARANFWTAEKINRAEYSEFAKGFEWIKADKKRVYRLTKRELEILHFYLGFNYFLSNEVEKALVEFKKVELIDENRSKLPIVNFYSGKCYEAKGEYDDALIEYRKLRRSSDQGKYPFINFLIAQGYYLCGEIDNGGEHFKRFKSTMMGNCDEASMQEIFEGEEWRLMILQIDHQQQQTLGYAKVWIDNEFHGNAKPFDHFDVKKSTGESIRKGAKEVGSYVARKVAKDASEDIVDKVLPGFGCLGGCLADKLLGSDDDDEENRFWNYAPAGFSLFVMPTRKEYKTIMVEYFDCEGRKIGIKKYYSDDAKKIDGTNTFVVNSCLSPEFYVY